MASFRPQSQTNDPIEPVPLNGVWKFQTDPDGTGSLDSLRLDREIPVPLPWQAAFPELRSYSGYAWYQREFDLPVGGLDGEALLRFGAVDYWCQVFVNRTLVGEHEGGYTPFEFPIRKYLQPGTNTLTVRVFDPAQGEIRIPRWKDANRQVAGARYEASEVPHGKQEWYLNAGGIWQDVSLVMVPPAWITSLQVTPDLAGQSASMAVTLAGSLGGLDGKLLRLTVLDGDDLAAFAAIPLESGRAGYQASLAVPQPRPWSLEDPHLYTAIAEMILPEGSHIETTRFGMRAFTTQDGRFLLNGKPVYLLAALDQDFYPGTIYTVLSKEYLRDEFRKARELGLNTLRCHIKIPDPLYLDLADEMGLLVWEEIPSWRTIVARASLDEKALEIPPVLKARVEKTLADMVQRDFNHPSLVIRTIVNEDWGTNLPVSAEDRAWVGTLYDRVKAMDPSRLAVDNSPCSAPWGPNVHVRSDVDDFHYYAGMPEGMQGFSELVRQFGRRPLWTYSSHGDSQRRGDEPLVVSEFGSWGLPALPALPALAGDRKGQEPGWFQVHPWGSSPWDAEMGIPSGVEARFERCGLGRLWPGYDDFARATQWHQYRALKFQIEALRREPALSGYVITELSDIYWESNGLLDFERSPKAYHDRFHQFNGADVVQAQPDRYAAWAGDPVEVKVYASLYSGRGEPGARLSWQLEGSRQAGVWSLPPAPRGSTGMAGRITLTLPEAAAPRQVRLQVTLHDLDGAEITHNDQEVLVYPRSARLAPQVGPVAVLEDEPEPVYGGGEARPTGQAREPKGALAGQLECAGYLTTGELSPDVRVAVSGQPTRMLLDWVRSGGRLLYLSDGMGPFFWNQHRGGSYSGSWISSYSWIEPGVHPRLRPRNPLGMEYGEVIPRSTILGLPFERAMADGDILAGMVSGWVHHPAAHTVQFRCGAGTVVMTTFTLRQAVGSDPVATAMFHDLLEHLASGRCVPKLAANY